MRAKIIKVGNSRGIRIPKGTLVQLGFEDEVDLAVDGSRLIIQAAKDPRAGWEQAAREQAMDSAARARLLPDFFEDEDFSDWVWDDEDDAVAAESRRQEES